MGTRGEMILRTILLLMLLGMSFFIGHGVATQTALKMIEQTRINTERVLKEAAKEFDKKEKEYIKTADFQFTRCIGEDDFWCLSTDQYIEFIMQLSMRRNCE